MPPQLSRADVEALLQAAASAHDRQLADLFKSPDPTPYEVAIATVDILQTPRHPVAD
jgi:hypothetical protein